MQLKQTTINMITATCKIKNFGPVKNANAALGDITILAGPDLFAKNTFLRLIKLILDGPCIVNTLRNNTVNLKTSSDLLNNYFGFGFSKLVKSKYTAKFNQNILSLTKLIKNTNRENAEKVFYIPAERNLIFDNGIPKTFGQHAPQHSFVLKNFSDKIWKLAYNHSSFINKFFSRVIAAADYKIQLRDICKDKQFVITNANYCFEQNLWTSCQNNFTQLLLGLCALEKENPKPQYIVIEEIENGLTPELINYIILQLIKLVNKGVSVILTTHSERVLELFWALTFIRGSKNPALYASKIFETQKNKKAREALRKIADSIIKIYCFSKFETYDISNLDVGSDNDIEKNWGWLFNTSARIHDTVAQIANEK